MKNKEHIVSSIRGGTFTMASEPSELSVFTSPHLSDFERRLFIDNLDVRSIEFSGSSNVQIFCRSLIHDLSKQIEGHQLNSPITRGSETILCIHSFAKLTTSWSWIKYVSTLYRQGFNIVMLDLPGFGKSSVGRDIRCPLSVWEDWDVQILTTFLRKMAIPRVNVLACYEGAAIFFDMLTKAPHLLGRNHILHNPVLPSAYFDNVAIAGIIRSFLTGGTKRRVFATFDRTQYPDPRSSSGVSIPVSVVEDLIVSEQFLQQISKSVGFSQVTISHVSSSDVAEVCLYDAHNEPGIRSLFGLYPSKQMRIYIARFLVGENLPPFQSQPPRIVGRLGESSEVVETTDRKEKPLRDTPSQNPMMNERGRISSEGKRMPLPTATVAKDSASFSYGVRLRQMEEAVAYQMALKESEQVYLEKHDEDDFLHQRALSESLVVTENPADAALRRVQLDPDEAQRASTYQARVEQSIRLESLPPVARVPLRVQLEKPQSASDAIAFGSRLGLRSGTIPVAKSSKSTI